jgi:Domain of unknown function (DUF4440)
VHRPGRRSSSPALESIKSQAELDKAIASLDAALFDSYNRCDLEKFGSFFFDDVEFYHDQGGVTLGKVKLTDSIKKNICGKVTRELVPGTLQVHYTHSHRAVEREHNAQERASANHLRLASSSP